METNPPPELKPSEILRNAANLILETDHTKRSFAVNKIGETRDPRASDACAYCVVGAMQKINGSIFGNSINIAVRYICRSELITVYQGFYNDAVYDWNDRIVTSKEHAVNALNNAAKLAESEGN